MATNDATIPDGCWAQGFDKDAWELTVQNGTLTEAKIAGETMTGAMLEQLRNAIRTRSTVSPDGTKFDLSIPGLGKKTLEKVTCEGPGDQLATVAVMIEDDAGSIASGYGTPGRIDGRRSANYDLAPSTPIHAIRDNTSESSSLSGHQQHWNGDQGPRGVGSPRVRPPRGTHPNAYRDGGHLDNPRRPRNESLGTASERSAGSTFNGLGLPHVPSHFVGQRGYENDEKDGTVYPLVSQRPHNSRGRRPGSSSSRNGLVEQTYRFPRIKSERKDHFAVLLQKYLRTRPDLDGIEIIECREGSAVPTFSGPPDQMRILRDLILSGELNEVITLREAEEGAFDTTGVTEVDADELAKGNEVRELERQRLKDQKQSAKVKRVMENLTKIRDACLNKNKGFESFRGKVAKACETGASLAKRIGVAGTNNCTRFLVLGRESCAKSTAIGAMCGKNIVHTQRGTATRCFITYDCAMSNDEVYKVMDNEGRKNAKWVTFTSVSGIHRWLTKKMRNIEDNPQRFPQGMSEEVIEVMVKCPDIRNMLITDGPGIPFADRDQAQRIMSMYARLMEKDKQDGVTVVPIIMRSMSLDGAGNDKAVTEIMEGMFECGVNLTTMNPVFLNTKADVVVPNILAMAPDSIKALFTRIWSASGVRLGANGKVNISSAKDAPIQPTFIAALAYEGRPMPSDETPPMSAAQKDEFYSNRVSAENDYYDLTGFRNKLEKAQIVIDCPLTGKKYQLLDFVGFNAFGTKLYERKMIPGLERLEHVVKDVEATLEELLELTKEPDLSQYTDWERLDEEDADLECARVKAGFKKYNDQQWQDMLEITQNPKLKWANKKWGRTLDVTLSKLDEWLESGKGSHLKVHLTEGKVMNAFKAYEPARKMNTAIAEGRGPWVVDEENPVQTARWLNSATSSDRLREEAQAADQTRFLATLKDVGRVFSVAAVERADKHFAFLTGHMRRAKCEDNDLWDRSTYGTSINKGSINSMIEFARKVGMDRWIWPAHWYIDYSTFLYMRMAEIVQKTVKDRSEDFTQLYDEYGDILEHMVHRPLERLIFDLSAQAIEKAIDYCKNMGAAGNDTIAHMRIMHQIGDTLNDPERLSDYLPQNGVQQQTEADGNQSAAPLRYRVGQPLSQRVGLEAYRSVQKTVSNTNFDTGYWRKSVKTAGNQADKVKAALMGSAYAKGEKILKPFVALSDTADGPHGDQVHRVVLGVFDKAVCNGTELQLFRVGVRTCKNGDVKVHISAKMVRPIAEEKVIHLLIKGHDSDNLPIPWFGSFDKRLADLEREGSSEGTKGGSIDMLRWLRANAAAAEDPDAGKHERTRIIDECFGADTTKLNNSISTGANGQDTMRQRVARFLQDEHAEQYEAFQMKGFEKLKKENQCRVLADMYFDCIRHSFKNRVQDIKKRYLAEPLESGVNPIKLEKKEKAKKLCEDFFEKDILLYRQCLKADAQNAKDDRGGKSVKGPAAMALHVKRELERIFEEQLQTQHERSEHVINCLEDITRENMEIYVRRKKEGQKTKEETERLERNLRELVNFRGRKSELYQAIIEMGEEYGVAGLGDVSS